MFSYNTIIWRGGGVTSRSCFFSIQVGKYVPRWSPSPLFRYLHLWRLNHIGFVNVIFSLVSEVQLYVMGNSWALLFIMGTGYYPQLGAYL